MAYEEAIKPLMQLERKLVQILQRKCNKVEKRQPIMRVFQNYIWQCLRKHYFNLRTILTESKSVTRAKIIPLPEVKLEVGKKSYRYVAVQYFNLLPNSLKNLISSKIVVKNRLKKWILTNV